MPANGPLPDTRDGDGFRRGRETFVVSDHAARFIRPPRRSNARQWPTSVRIDQRHLCSADLALCLPGLRGVDRRRLPADSEGRHPKTATMRSTFRSGEARSSRQSATASWGEKLRLARRIESRNCKTSCCTIQQVLGCSSGK